MFPPLMGVLLILQKNAVGISYNYYAIFIYCRYCKQNYDDDPDTFKANRCYCFALILYVKKSDIEMSRKRSDFKQLVPKLVSR